MPARKKFSAGRTAALILSLAVFCLFLMPPLFCGIYNIGSTTGLIVFGMLSLILLRLPQFLESVRKLCGKSGGRLFLRILSILLSCILALAIVLAVLIFGAALRQPSEQGTMIVLGAQVNGSVPSIMLEERLRRAESYLKEHTDVPCIVSGGQGALEDISEAQAMADWLEDHGIAKDRIILESESTSTEENLFFSAEVLRKENLPESVILVTNEFHEYRAMYYAKKAGLTPSPASAGTRIWLFPTYFVREMYGILSAWLSI
jgi:uncharacterized SAM-binding protein YcdF (DUF218 family)